MPCLPDAMLTTHIITINDVVTSFCDNFTSFLKYKVPPQKKIKKKKKKQLLPTFLAVMSWARLR